MHCGHPERRRQPAGKHHLGAAVPHENYVLLNLRLSYDLFDWLQLFINIENLTDTRYTIIYGYELPGITATSGFRVHL